MRLCRFGTEENPRVGFYDEARVVPLAVAAAAYTNDTGDYPEFPASTDLLDFLPPDGKSSAAAAAVARWLAGNPTLPAGAALDPAGASLLVPVPRPNKLFLLAGNYAEHVVERGGVAAERAETFPYVFMKPPSTTLTPSGRPARDPGVSPRTRWTGNWNSPSSSAGGPSG